MRYIRPICIPITNTAFDSNSAGHVHPVLAPLDSNGNIAVTDSAGYPHTQIMNDYEKRIASGSYEKMRKVLSGEYEVSILVIGAN